MKPIKFEQLSLMHNPFKGILLLLVTAVVVLDVFDALPFLEPETRRITAKAASLLLLLHGIYPFFYRNHVQWNKAGIALRVNNFWGHRFSFKNVINIVYAADAYTVYLHSGSSAKVINLEGIDMESRVRLQEILQAHVG